MFKPLMKFLKYQTNLTSFKSARETIKSDKIGHKSYMNSGFSFSEALWHGNVNFLMICLKV